MNQIEVRDVEPMMLLMELAKITLPEATTIILRHSTSREVSFMRLKDGGECESPADGVEERWCIEAVKGSSLNRVLDDWASTAEQLAKKIAAGPRPEQWPRQYAECDGISSEHCGNYR